MTEAVPSEAPRRQNRRGKLRYVLPAWAIVVALFLLWQTLNYQGVIALAAEWEFNTFGHYYPTLTYVLLVVLVGSPVLWLLRIAKDERPAMADDTSTAGDRQAPRLPGRGFIRSVAGFAVGCAVAALVVLIAMLSLPSDQGEAKRIVIGSAAAATPDPGPVILVGDVVIDRVAGLSEDLLITRRSIRIAPLRAPGIPDGALQYFAEIRSADALAAARRDGSLEGILRRGGLPGELERLFRYAGFDVVTPYYVLFATHESMTWQYRVAAVELLLAALVCAIAAAGLHLRRERIRNSDRDGKTPTPPATPS